jgi:hypothetical protein
MVDMRSAEERTWCSVASGEWYSVLRRGSTVIAEWRRRKKRARGGKESIQKVRKVLRQEGSEGCRVAQEREVIRGCAREVRGETPVSVGGRTFSLVGNMVGEM